MIPVLADDDRAAAIYLVASELFLATLTAPGARPT